MRNSRTVLRSISSYEYKFVHLTFRTTGFRIWVLFYCKLQFYKIVSILIINLYSRENICCFFWKCFRVFSFKWWYVCLEWISQYVNSLTQAATWCNIEQLFVACVKHVLKDLFMLNKQSNSNNVISVLFNWFNWFYSS